MKKLFVAVALGVAGVALAWGCARLAPGANSAAPGTVGADAAMSAAGPVRGTAATDTAAVSASTLRERLQGIVIPTIEYTDADMAAVFRDINHKINAQDGEPVCFIFHEALDPAPVAPAVKDAEQGKKEDAADLIPLSPVQAELTPVIPPPDPCLLQWLKRRVTISMSNVPADEALHYICMSSGLVFFVMDSNVIQIEDRNVSRAWEMVTRSYPVYPAMLEQMKVEQGNGLPDAYSYDSIEEQLRRNFAAYGVPSPVGFKMVYDPDIQRLFVTLPPADLAKMEIVLGEIYSNLPVSGQVLVQSRLVRVSEAALKKLDIDPATGMTGNFDRSFGGDHWLKLALSPDAEILASGSVLTVKDRETVLEAVAKVPTTGNPIKYGYTLHVLAKQDPARNDRLRVKVTTTLAGRDGGGATADVSGQPEQKMAEMDHTADVTASYWCRWECVWGQKTNGKSGETEWSFLLVGTQCVAPGYGDFLARCRKALPSLPPPGVRNPSAKLAAILKTTTVSDLAPTADLGTILTTKLKECGVTSDFGVVYTPGMTDCNSFSSRYFPLPVKIGVCGTTTLGRLLDHYLRVSGLEAKETEDGRLVAGRLGETWFFAVPKDELEKRLKNPVPGSPEGGAYMYEECSSSERLREFVENRFSLGGTEAGIAYNMAIEKLIVRARPDRVFEVGKLFTSGVNRRQVRLHYEAVEIPQAEVRALAKSIKTEQGGTPDVFGIAKSAEFCAAVRSSPRATLVASLSTVAPLGKEVVAEDVRERVATAAAASGTRLKITASLRDQGIIHLKLNAETTGDAAVVGGGWWGRKRTADAASQTVDTEFELYDGETILIAGLAGGRRAESAASQSFFGADNVFKPGAKLGEERELFVFVTARIVEGE